jgi:uncharacterized membrane protein YeaQ/YmgE (transglycosylase-associated protein family)
MLLGRLAIVRGCTSANNPEKADGDRCCTGFNLYSMLVAVIGAIIVLVVYHLVTGRRAVT